MGKLDFESLVADPRQEIVRKWDRDEFLEDIENPTVKTNTALVLENQFAYLTESGGTSVSDISVMKKLTIPMVRRVFPGLIAHDLVAVQPMSSPVGLAYAMRRHRISADGGVEYYDQTSDDTGYPDAASRYADIENDIDKAQPQAGWTGPNNTWSGERQGSDSRLFDNLQSDNTVTTFDIQEVGISIISKEIRAKTRKLKARFPIEVQQDLHSMHNVDIRRELTDMLSYEVTAEIDQEILAAIKVNALNGGKFTWDYTTSADGRFEAEKYRTLITVINLAANEIAVANRIGAGNYLIASPRVCGVLESMPEFKAYEMSIKLNTYGTPAANSYVGTLGRFKVYRDVFTGFTADYILVGYKGTGNNDAGIIYAPYVPVMFDEAKAVESFQTNLGVMTRYAIVSNMFGSENYFRYIEVSFDDSKQPGPSSPEAGQPNPYDGYERAPKEIAADTTDPEGTNWDTQGQQ